MRDDQPFGVPPSRRMFLQVGSAALLAGPDRLAALVASFPVAMQPGTLRPRAQYLSEAAEFDSGISDLGSAARLSVDSSTLTRFTGLVSGAGLKLDRCHSWMVAQCLADASLERWVRSTVRDDATFNALIANLKRSPKALDTVPEVATLRRRLAALRAEKLGIIDQVIAKERAIAGLQASGTRAASRAAEAQECEQTWAIVTSILLIVMATVVAATVVTTAVTSLAGQYKGTGAEQTYTAGLSANRSYQQCVDAAASLPPAERAKAIAACQMRWLEEKTANVV